MKAGKGKKRQRQEAGEPITQRASAVPLQASAPSAHEASRSDSGQPMQPTNPAWTCDTIGSHCPHCRCRLTPSTCLTYPRCHLCQLSVLISSNHPLNQPPSTSPQHHVAGRFSSASVKPTTQEEKRDAIWVMRARTIPTHPRVHPSSTPLTILDIRRHLSHAFRGVRRLWSRKEQGKENTKEGHCCIKGFEERVQQFEK